ncbi:MAG: hypothetical protein OXU31_02610 [Gammaproteobacteria bacterium]|nr:hypothetical protein [Gammaproteobacteria bacterium]
MNDGERKTYAKEKRDKCEKMSGGVVLRDQQPLNADKIEFSDGTKFRQYVMYLNKHVFFWPGNYRGRKGIAAFRKKYPGHIELRCKLGDLLDNESEDKVLFSPYNSGATPRNPKKSPRCLCLFQPLKSRKGQSFVEVVFRGQVRLPDNIKYKTENGKWHPFFTPKNP